MRWWIFFLVSCKAFAVAVDSEELVLSTPEEIVSLDTSLLVEGFVSAASGQLSLMETDLAIEAAQDLLLNRVYVSPQIFGRYHDKDEYDRLELGKALFRLPHKQWETLPHLWAHFKGNRVWIPDPSGTVLEFQVEGNRGILKTPSYGCSNLRGSQASAEADIRNIEFTVHGRRIWITWPNGVQRVYDLCGFSSFRLNYERLPNNKVIRYSYENPPHIRIQSTDITGKYVYAQIDRLDQHRYKSLDGREASYYCQDQMIRGEAKRGRGKEIFKHPVSLLMHAKSPAYENTARYNERTLLTFYDKQSYPISCSYHQPGGAPCRVSALTTPSGTTSFTYDPPIPGSKEGSTTVIHPNGTQTIYRFNANYLLSAIENWWDGKLYNQKAFFYDHKQHISKIETKDGQGRVLLATSYECDSSGNPLLEKWETDAGIFTIRKTFSKNRVLKEERSDGLGIEYSYLGDTHLLTSKTTFFYEKPAKKTEYFYDEAYNLIEEAEVGKTRITYLLYQNAPHLHRVEWKIEKDWEQNLIHKTHFSYDSLGHVVKESRYGSDGQLTYQITKTYDSKGNLIQETNPLGQTASYKHDERGRCVYEVPFAQNLTIQRAFDAKGRLTTLKEGDHTTHFVYNHSDELIEKTDYLGLKTKYLYHPIHHQPIRIEKDPTLLEIAYDDFGREIARKDAYGATTLTERNSYGDPKKITHPDGGEEIFSYAPNRTLLSAQDPDGLTTFYTYDPLKRVLSKTTLDRTSTYRYDAYHLLEEKDPSNVSTYYEYNLAGQKIRETRQDRTLRFSYDPLGFLSKKENGARWTSYQNDVLGRTLSKSIDGKLFSSYTYDPAGNVSSITKKATEFFVYDPYNRLIEIKDPLGAQTTIRYEEGDQFLKKIIKNPKGTERIELYNAHGQILRKEVPGCTLQEFSYDRALRLVSHDHLSFTYTPEGRRASLSESGQRTTYWTYTPGGKIAAKTKPDGTTLFYQYTPFGELAKVGSRTFEYNSLGQLVKGSGFTRDYDDFGNVIQETFTTNLSVKTEYDPSDRPIRRVLPDASCINYEYDGPFLAKVYRQSANGDLLYTHSYDQFDQNGNLLQEGGYFTTTYVYDEAGRKVSQISPYFSETLAYDASGNLIQKGNLSLSYDAADQIISIGNAALSYDKHSNRTALNDTTYPIDPCNQLSQLPYNANGCLVFESALFDEFDQPIVLNHEPITYDALGRRLQKGDTFYLYFENEEVGAFDKTGPKELKIPGLRSPVAIEIASKPYHPVLDVQNVIRKLIDPETKTICQENTCDPFGLGLNLNIPYAYLGKRADADTGLIYFGKRYYVPSMGRWLTPDPIGPIDHSNLYQYVFNNPYVYQDPTGEFAFVIPILFFGAEVALPTLTACLTAIGYGAAIGTVAYAGYSLIETLNAYACPAVDNLGNIFDIKPFYDARELAMEKNESEEESVKSGKEHTPDQAAISDLVKGTGKKGVSNADADTLLDWAKECNFPHRDDRGKPHWDARGGMDHIHLGPKHIPVNS